MLGWYWRIRWDILIKKITALHWESLLPVQLAAYFGARSVARYSIISIYYLRLVFVIRWKWVSKLPVIIKIQERFGNCIIWVKSNIDSGKLAATNSWKLVLIFQHTFFQNFRDITLIGLWYKNTWKFLIFRWSLVYKRGCFQENTLSETVLYVKKYFHLNFLAN